MDTVLNSNFDVKDWRAFDVERLLDKHNDKRLNAINLIVSENRMTRRATVPLASDIQARYAATFYAGTEPAQEIIDLTAALARKVFKARYANLSPISGNVALLSVIFALTKNGESVGRVPPFFPGGGYPLNYEAFDRQPLPLPFSEETWQLDLEKTLELLDTEKPPLVILGSSIVTYPMPVQEVADLVHDYGGVVAYDGSHTLGLIAGGQYQDPLVEGADILLGSTHKTFPGPQGGIILSNDKELMEEIDRYSNFTPLNGPTMICNPHLARIASTGIVLEETKWKEYADRVVCNSRAIAKVFLDNRIPMHGEQAENFSELTYCHQVVTDYDRDTSFRLRDLLHVHRINVDGFMRIGTSEITRLGYDEEAAVKLAELCVQVIKEDVTSDVVGEIDNLIRSHQEVVI